MAGGRLVRLYCYQTRKTGDLLFVSSMFDIQSCDSVERISIKYCICITARLESPNGEEQVLNR